MIRKWRNQKEIPTPKTEGWGKTKLALRYLYQENSRVSSYFPIGGHSATRA